MKTIQTVVLAIAFLATTGPIAHLLELPSKLTLEGPLWLSVQQHLYRGWGIVYGPIEVLALLSCVVLMIVTRRDEDRRNAYLIAAACYGSMILYFFLFNDWVNDALTHWTAATLPANWSDYRLKWETGHALSALFSVIAFVTLLHARMREAAQQREDAQAARELRQADKSGNHELH
ncbi:MAG: anthrone oxygenase family protein [Rhizomicrobium sp.]